MTNADVTETLLDAYCVSNLHLAYTFKMRAAKSITIGCTIYNLFNEEYENNGYAGSGYYTDNGQKIRYNYAGYAADVGRLKLPKYIYRVVEFVYVVTFQRW